MLRISQSMNYVCTITVSIISVLLVLFTFIQPTSASTKVNQIIIEAKVIPYSQIPNTERNDLNKYDCCTYLENNGSTTLNRVHFNAEDAYFVQATINPLALSRILLSDSCEGESWSKRCSSNRIEEKLKQLIGYSNPYMFYGKYMNHWVFLNQNEIIPATAKFVGHDILSINSNENSSRHTLIIGPLPQKPDHMRIQPYYFDKSSENSEELEIDLS